MLYIVLTVIVVLLGMWKFRCNPNITPYELDFNSPVLTIGKQVKRYIPKCSVILKIWLPICILVPVKTIRGQITILGLWITMWINDYHYPPTPPFETSTEFSLSMLRNLWHEAMHITFVLALWMEEPTEYTIDAFIVMTFGLGLFIGGFVAKTDFDEQNHISNILLTDRLFQRNTDMTLNQKVLCTPHRARIIQHIGLAFLSGNKVFYCYSCVISVILTIRAIRIHKNMTEVVPNAVGGRSALLEEFSDAHIHQGRVVVN
ncbi:hypothetical protein L5515_018058 [Caenorhabditis briggsae]|uniref:Uncharacterized protein n=1 Tax=Caenorhabditis briggsae TaxID=6238 RepID=A0AAE9JRS2_CAEBR|nr:hypothetical protein L5515_018058 [Caenorhabditis briggsae]